MLAPVGTDHMDRHPVVAIIGRANDPGTVAEAAERLHVEFTGHKLAHRHPMNKVL